MNKKTTEIFKYTYNKWKEISLNYMNIYDSEYIWAKIANKYNNPNRHYHNIEHLHKMIINMEIIERELNSDYLHEIYFAIFFHDYIYSTIFTKSNEKRSAKHMHKYLNYHLSDRSKSFIYEAILATKNHVKTDNLSINVFLDLDMLILSEDRTVYENYVNGIFKEFYIYPKKFLIRKRKKFINYLLNKNVYITDYFKNHNLKAELNLKRELESYT